MQDVRLKEEKRHGEPDFPVQYYYVDNSHPRYVMALHWHSEIEIVRVKQGTLTLYVNNIPYTLTSGEAALIAPGMLHRAEPDLAVYECAVFDLGMLCRQSAGRISRYVMPIASCKAQINGVKATGELLCLADAFFACLTENKEFYEIEAYSIVARLVYLLFSDGKVDLYCRKSTSHSGVAVAFVLEWIENNYSDKITLLSLAEVSRISEKYLCRIFKEYTGMSPIEYVNHYRTERACERMAEGLNVTEAALECGFNDVSYFSKIFKRYKNKTPKEYKTALRP